MAGTERLVLNSTNTIVIKNLRDTDDGSLITGATVTAVVTDRESGTPVSGVPNPISFTESVTTNGLYTGTVPAAASLTNGQDVDVTVTAVDGAREREFVIEAVVVTG